MGKDQRGAMEAYVQVMNPGLSGANVPDFADFFAEDVVYTHWRWGDRELVGKENLFSRYFEPLSDSFPDLDFQVFDVIYGETKLVVRGEFSATFVKDWGWVPAHGRRVRWFAHDIYEFRDGKIVRAWYANDTLKAARQLGVLANDGRIIGGDPFASE
jgi:predicted ester cyclase